jgi:hypothetical protein
MAITFIFVSAADQPPLLSDVISAGYFFCDVSTSTALHMHGFHHEGNRYLVEYRAPSHLLTKGNST